MALYGPGLTQQQLQSPGMVRMANMGQAMNNQPLYPQPGVAPAPVGPAPVPGEDVAATQAAMQGGYGMPAAPQTPWGPINPNFQMSPEAAARLNAPGANRQQFFANHPQIAAQLAARGGSGAQRYFNQGAMGVGAVNRLQGANPAQRAKFFANHPQIATAAQARGGRGLLANRIGRGR